MSYTKVTLNDVGLSQRLIAEIPELDIPTNPKFKSVKKKDEKRDFLVSLVKQSVFREREHSDFKDCDSFTYTELTGSLTRGYKEYLEPLYDFDHKRRGFFPPTSKSSGTTKAYALKPTIQEKARRAVRDYDTHARIVDEHGIEKFRRKWPENGNECRTSIIRVPALIPVELSILNETIDVLEQREEELVANGWDDATRTIGQLLNCLRWVAVANGIPNFYKEQRHGRLGRLGQLNIIDLSSTTRFFLFRGTGWHDYDFRNCHYSIFQSLCHYHGLDVPHIDEWVFDRDNISQKFASELGVPPKKLKGMMLSMLNGSKGETPRKLLGKERMEVLNEDPWFREFKKELRAGSKMILQDHPLPTTNAVGKKRWPTPERSAQKEARSRLNHIFTGYERWMLEQVCGNRGEPKALIYDGWIGEKVDVAELEELIFDRSVQAFGFPLVASIKDIPIPDSVDEIIEQQLK